MLCDIYLIRADPGGASDVVGAFDDVFDAKERSALCILSVCDTRRDWSEFVFIIIVIVIVGGDERAGILREEGRNEVGGRRRR